jgi:hypothetical protein
MKYVLVIRPIENGFQSTTAIITFTDVITNTVQKLVNLMHEQVDLTPRKVMGLCSGIEGMHDPSFTENSHEQSNEFP